MGMALGISARHIQMTNNIWAKLSGVILPVVPVPVIEALRCNEKYPCRDYCEQDNGEGPGQGPPL